MVEIFLLFMFLGIVLAVIEIAKVFLNLAWSIVAWFLSLFDFDPLDRVTPGLSSGIPRDWEPPRHPESESRYTRDWQQISRNLREDCGWQCQDCGVYLGGSSNERRLLHVHHRDLNPQNNDPNNLEVLCVICHSERPGTGHRRLAGAISNDGRQWEVLNLRRYQGK